MYSENNKQISARRANDEFLRRMLGGELTGDGLPTVRLQESSHNAARPVNAVAPQQRRMHSGTEETFPKKENDCSSGDDCHEKISAPSLAMVYCPKQCWRKLLDPAQGLSAGSIFEELILPLEVRSGNFNRKGGTPRCNL